MIFNIITKARDKWFNSDKCTIKELITYMVDKGEMRDSQIDAIKTYLFLKIECDNKPIYQLMIEGKFNEDIDINNMSLRQNTRNILNINKSAMALFQYSLLKDDNGNLLYQPLYEEICNNTENIDFVQALKNMFAKTIFTNYLFSLPMGAGKTFLMASFIYLDLYFALNEPTNKAFAHNFFICAPSGLKSSVVPSLKTIQNFDATWILPVEAVNQIKKILKFEVLDSSKTDKKSNKIKNPNVQKIANYQPYDSLMGLVLITNAEKVILDNININKKSGQITFEDYTNEEKAMNELKKFIGYIPNLAVIVDEVHHLADDDIKMNYVVKYWYDKQIMNSLLGFSGTPFYNQNIAVEISQQFIYKTKQIPFIVNYFPLVKAVETFLKKPTIRFSENRDSEQIIRLGLKEFFDTYLNTSYLDGVIPKIAIYCGRIAKLREQIYPLCCEIASEYNLNPDEVILCYHGNDSTKKYSVSKNEELEFLRLDDKSSKIRIVLLAQIGKEGWDCKSLTGVILSQEGDCPDNMVLQTSCRCLRQVDKNSNCETALIWLNEYNANILNQQLQSEQHTSIQQINSIVKKDRQILKRYDRTKQLKLDDIEYNQFRVQYKSVKKDDDLTIEEKLQNINICKENFAIRSMHYDGSDKGVVRIEQDYGNDYITYSSWLLDIKKESFDFIKLSELNKYNEILKKIFDAITIKQDNYYILNRLYDNELIKSEIRKSFVDKYTFETVEEIYEESNSLLNKNNFTEKILTDEYTKYYPTQQNVEEILLADRRGSLYTPDQKKQMQILIDNGMGDRVELLFNLPLPIKSKDKSFHYLPYNFSQSSFEKNVFEEILKYINNNNIDLEIYYNGDRGLTSFKIRCYRKVGLVWNYVGIYTPDFLIVKRNNNKIEKALIIETKGVGYSTDKNFIDKKQFMNNKFIEINNDKFDYMYIQDDEKSTDYIKRLCDKIDANFKEDK